MTTIFILGAGASAAAGAPLMADFLDRAWEISRNLRMTEEGAPFRDVQEALSDLQVIHAKSRLDVDNIETLFSVVEMGKLLGRFPGRDADGIDGLRASMIGVIVRTLEAKLLFPVRDHRRVPPTPYDALGKALVEAWQNRGREKPPFSFLTFNYDMALDLMLHSYGMPYDYALGEKFNETAIPLLKLHGSINWGRCGECGEVIPWRLEEVQDSQPLDRPVALPIGSSIANKQHCGKPLPGPPVLVPPTWNKTEYHQTIGRVWRRAAAELAAATNVVVVGYSLPETDSFFRYLFALGSEGRTRIRRFWVLNPDPDGTVRQRFERFIGGDLQHRLKFFTGDEGRWEKNLVPIYEVLRDETKQ
jgi:hypothetical protein